jgi:hypothetical protein
MTGMSGVGFLTQVKELSLETIRIVWGVMYDSVL